MALDSPPQRPLSQPEANLGRLIEIMVKLRDPNDGCSWDRAQTFESIAPYTIEEAYEVADAISRRDPEALCEELGDLLLQVIYHAQIASESNLFTLLDVIKAISNKMIRRHPHILGAEVGSPDWETIKAHERSAKASGASALAGVALSLPALLRAEKLQKRAARVGFDWPDVVGPVAKVKEELDEIQRASSASEREEELGDLLFAAVNLARHMQIDPESALRKANAKFEKRFRSMEECVGTIKFAEMSLEQKEALWQQIKQSASH